jgi:DNA-binding NtrC family response regulator
MSIDTRSSRHVSVLSKDRGILNYVNKALSRQHRVGLFSEAEDFMRVLSAPASPDLLLLDSPMDQGGKGEERALALLPEIRSAKPTMPLIVLTCSTDLNSAAAAARMGATGFLLKPFKREEIQSTVQSCLDGLEPAGQDNQAKEIPLGDNISFVRSCKRMCEIEKQCTLVARANIPVLVLGESGTGKEVAAKLIHKRSARSEKIFMKVNCAAMPADLLESELFGYEQGAFTGAVKSKPGKFELCNHGTILLDEIGEMPTLLQAKLLQVLQDGSFTRLGGRAMVKVDVRVIAATNIDIKSSIEQRTFREDLYYRLNGISLHMPPLRERREEIPLLAQHFMRKTAASFKCDSLAISPTLMQALLCHSWPGNLRELENVIRRYVVLGDEQAIVNDLHTRVGDRLLSRSENRAEAGHGLKHLVRDLKGDAESTVIREALDHRAWNRKATATDLQISYEALLYKIKQYGIVPSLGSGTLRGVL